MSHKISTSLREIIKGGSKKDLSDDEENEVESDDESTNSISDDDNDQSDTEDGIDKEKDDIDDVPKIKIDDDGDGDEQDDDTCLYNIKGKLSSKILETDVFDEDFFADETIIQSKKVVPKDERITKPILTKYERVRILSERRKQLILGAKPMIKTNKLISEKDVASLELKAKVIPFIIVRTLPNGNIEHWHLDELEIIN